MVYLTQKGQNILRIIFSKQIWFLIGYLVFLLEYISDQSKCHKLALSWFVPKTLKTKPRIFFVAGFTKKTKCFGHAILYQKAHIGNISFMNWCLIGEEKSLIL